MPKGGGGGSWPGRPVYSVSSGVFFYPRGRERCDGHAGMHTREGERRRESTRRSHSGVRNGLAFSGIGRCDRVDDRLGLFLSDFCMPWVRCRIFAI